MTIEKNGNKWRVKQMYKGVMYRVSVDFKPTKKEAEELIRKKIAISPSHNIRDTFEECSLKYIDIKSNIISPSTIRGYKSMLKNMPASFKSLKISDITQEIIQKTVNDYAADHSAKSTHNLHGFISAVLGVYNPNMRLNTTLPQKVKYKAYTPTEEEVKKVLEEVKGTEYELPYRLGVYGLRRGEICAITSGDVKGNILTINKSKVLDDSGKWIIKPIPKTTDSQREIYIDSDLAKMIKKKGVAFSDHPNRLNHHLRRTLKKLDIPVFRFHDMRAYYASMAHSLGIPDAYIMANGGWSSTNILNRVYKRAFSDKQEEVNRSIAEHLKP